MNFQGKSILILIINYTIFTLKMAHYIFPIADWWQAMHFQGKPSSRNAGAPENKTSVVQKVIVPAIASISGVAIWMG